MSSIVGVRALVWLPVVQWVSLLTDRLREGRRRELAGNLDEVDSHTLVIEEMEKNEVIGLGQKNTLKGVFFLQVLIRVCCLHTMGGSFRSRVLVMADVLVEGWEAILLSDKQVENRGLDIFLAGDHHFYFVLPCALLAHR